MSELAEALRDAGGASAGREHGARLRALLLDELRYGSRELERARSGYPEPVTVALAGADGQLLAACPAEDELRADPQVTSERGWLLIAALVGATVRAAELRAPSRPEDLALRTRGWERWLVLTLPTSGGDEGEAAELAALELDEEIEAVDRLRARTLVVPRHVLEPLGEPRTPIGASHPLRIAEAVARLGGQPADDASVDEHEEAVLALLQPPEALVRAHDDPDPVRRMARRILQKLDGMGKWGGYHTEFVHLTRGFAPGNDRALAGEVGERLIRAGLLVEKISVGQRHVHLNPRRSGEIRRLIDDGAVPPGLVLP
jgi:hypothetical protein